MRMEKKMSEAPMIDENLARLRAHRNNIHRYRRLLGTQLTELERHYIERRLSEEMEAAKRLSNETFPLALRLPAQRCAEDDPLRSPKVWNRIEGEHRAPSLPDRSQAA
jgi:hypothetical protein